LAGNTENSSYYVAGFAFIDGERTQPYHFYIEVRAEIFLFGG
jgi:hypothetical protein